MATQTDNIQRSILPIPDRPRTGLITYDAKDPDTKYPAIQELRPPKDASVEALDASIVPRYRRAASAGKGRFPVAIRRHGTAQRTQRCGDEEKAEKQSLFITSSASKRLRPKRHKQSPRANIKFAWSSNTTAAAWPKAAALRPLYYGTAQACKTELEIVRVEGRVSREEI